MKFTITRQTKGKKIVYTCKDEAGTVIDTRTTTHREYGFCTVVRKNERRAANACKSNAASYRLRAAEHRAVLTGTGPAYNKAVRDFSLQTVTEWVNGGKFAEWIEDADKRAAELDAAAERWEAGTEPNPAQVIGWSSKLTNCPKPRAGSTLDVLGFATLAA